MIVHNAKGRSGNIYPTFIYIAKRQKTTNCSIRVILIDVVEDKVVDLSKAISLSTAERQRIEAAVLEQLAASSRDNIQHRKALLQKKDRLARERNQLLQAHYADAIPIDLLRTEQDRITRARANIESEFSLLATDEGAAKTNLTLILDLLENCHRTYSSLPAHLRRLLNLAVFEKVLILDRRRPADPS